MGGYKVNDNIQLKLNIDNIFDRTYYQSLDYGWSGGLARYGAPRNALLTLNYKM
ncbi:Ferric-pseudobactin receptor precursor [compost metagenome]